MARLKRWWVGKYHLPASHDLFQCQTVAELLQEQLEDLYEEVADLERQLDAGAGRAAPAMQSRFLSRISRTGLF